MICDNTGRNTTSNLSSTFLQVSYKDIEVSKTHDNYYFYYRKHIVMILILLGVRGKLFHIRVCIRVYEASEYFFKFIFNWVYMQSPSNPISANNGL